MRKCEKCGGQGPCLWDDKTGQYVCRSCHSNPDDPFFEKMDDNCRPVRFWSAEDFDGELTHTEPEEAAAEIAEDNCRCFEDGWEVTVVEWAPEPISPQWMERQARWLFEHFAEQFGEDYGDAIDGSAEDDLERCGADESEMLALIQKWCSRASVWRCETTGRKETFDAEWARNEWPGDYQTWLDEGGDNG